MTLSSNIAIVGAGTSGLAAALLLAEAGAKHITIFEARREAGGRTRSYLDPATGDVLDNGQHLLMGCYTSTLEYLDMIGTSDKVTRLPLSVRFWSDTGVRSFTIDRALAPPFNLLSGIMRTSLLTLPEKKAASTLGNMIWRDKLPRQLRDMTCAELFAKCEQPPATVQKLWEPIVLATLNASPDQASATLLINVIREAFFSSRKASNILLPSVGLSELLIDPAVKKLEASGVTVRLGCPVRKIERDNGQVVISTHGSQERFDLAIIATESPLELTDTPYPFTHSRSPIVNAFFWLDRSIFSAPLHAFVGMTLQWAFPRQSNFSAQRVALTVSAANVLLERSNEEITAILWDDLLRTVPAAKEAELLHSQIIREKRATPLLTPSAQNTRPKIELHEGNLIYAGDLVQNGLPATIEGAIRNGFRAARLALGEKEK